MLGHLAEWISGNLQEMCIELSGANPSHERKALTRVATVTARTIIYRAIGARVRRIARPCLLQRVYFHISNTDDDVWNQLTLGSRLSFNISFGIRGANANSVAIIGRQIEIKEAQIKLFGKSQCRPHA